MSNLKNNNNNEHIILPWDDPFEDTHVCATTKSLKECIKNDPTFKERYLEEELKIRDRAKQKAKNNLSTSGVYEIKVYFHLIGNSAEQTTITESVLQQQITSLNEDFRKTHGNTPTRWVNEAADTNIQFTWNTPDVNRVTSSTTFDPDNAMKFNAGGGSDAYQTSKYLNVWICTMNSGILGYAQFPLGATNTDGVVVATNSLKGPTGVAPYNLGRTLTHEVGHWLNLLHIWGDGGCFFDDLLSDTPAADGPSFGCPLITKDTCTTDSLPDMWENYMDYTDDVCMNMFTVGQKDRMIDCLENNRSEVYTIVGGSTPTTTTPAPGILTLVDDYSGVAGGIIESSSENNWSNSGAVTNFVYGNNPGSLAGQNGLYVFSQDSTGDLNQEYSYVTESGAALSGSHGVLSRNGVSNQVYSFYKLGGPTSKVGLFNINPSSGTATLSASSLTFGSSWGKLSQDQYYLYVTGLDSVYVLDPISLSLLATISTPIDSGGYFNSLESWSNGDYLFVACANSGVKVYEIDHYGNTFTYVNTYGDVSFGINPDMYFGVFGDGNFIYTVGTGQGYQVGFVKIYTYSSSTGMGAEVAELRDTNISALYSCFVKGSNLFAASEGGSLSNSGIRVYSFNQSTTNGSILEQASDVTLTNSWVVDVVGDDNYVYLSHYPKVNSGDGGIRVYSYTALTTTTTSSPGVGTTTTSEPVTTTLMPGDQLACFDVGDIYCLSITNDTCNKAISGEVRILDTTDNVELEPLCDQSILDEIGTGDTVVLCKGNCASGGGELYVADVDPTCSINGDFWIKLDQSGSIINFYKKEVGAWVEKDKSNPCGITTTTTVVPTTTTTTTTTTALPPNGITITSPSGEYNLLSQVSLLSVTISGPSEGYDHWRWKLDADFPSVGVAGGNAVTSGTTATLNITTIGTHTISVALVDGNGNMIIPAVKDSVEIIIGPTNFVEGNVPNWNQIHYYETQGNFPVGTATSSGSKFKAWGAPCAAASQLGHLNVYHGLIDPKKSLGHLHGISDGVDAGAINQANTGTSTIGWNETVANGGGHGWGDYLADGDIWRPTINTVPSWYSLTPTTIGGCTLTDFGWFMNTNNSSEDVAQPSPSGTRIGDGLIDHTTGGVGTNNHNIYKGLKDFYRTAGYDNVVGVIYHWQANGSDVSEPSNVVLPAGVPEQPVGIAPQYWTDNDFDNLYLSGSWKTAGADSSAVWAIIKSEINSNRTIIAAMQGWSIEPMSSITTDANFPNTTHAVEKASLANSGGDGIAYYKVKAEVSNNLYNNEDYTTTSESPTIPLWGGTALGHATLIVGYIPAGAADDISTNKDTDWIILRDNDELTERNVIVPFKSVTSSPTNNVDTVRWGFDCLMATIYTDISQSAITLPVCTTTTTTAGPTTTTTAGPTTTTTVGPTTTTTVGPTTTTTPCPDPNWSNVKLLIQSEAADDTNEIIDSSPSCHTVVESGSVHHETDEAKFGNSSLYFQHANSDSLAISKSSDWDFGVDDVTIEFWMNAGNYGNNGLGLTSSGTIMAIGQGTYNVFKITNEAGAGGTNQGRITVSWGNDAITGSFLYDANPTNGVINDNNWHHIALERMSGEMHLHFDGNLVDNQPFNNNSGTAAYWDLSDCSITIGGGQDCSGCRYQGYLEDIRITKGIALYSTNGFPLNWPGSAVDPFIACPRSCPDPSQGSNGTPLSLAQNQIVFVAWDDHANSNQPEGAALRSFFISKTNQVTGGLANGTITLKGEASVPGANYRQICYDGRFLYAASTGFGAVGQNHGIHCLSADTDGIMTHLDTHRPGNTHATGVWSDGNFIYAAMHAGNSSSGVYDPESYGGLKTLSVDETSGILTEEHSVATTFASVPGTICGSTLGFPGSNSPETVLYTYNEPQYGYSGNKTLNSYTVNSLGEITLKYSVGAGLSGLSTITGVRLWSDGYFLYLTGYALDDVYAYQIGPTGSLTLAHYTEPGGFGGPAQPAGTIDARAIWGKNSTSNSGVYRSLYVADAGTAAFGSEKRGLILMNITTWSYPNGYTDFWCDCGSGGQYQACCTVEEPGIYPFTSTHANIGCTAVWGDDDLVYTGDQGNNGSAFVTRSLTTGVALDVWEVIESPTVETTVPGGKVVDIWGYNCPEHPNACPTTTTTTTTGGPTTTTTVGPTTTTTTTTEPPFSVFSATDCVSGSAIEFKSQLLTWSSSLYYRVSDTSNTYCILGSQITSSSTALSQITLNHEPNFTSTDCNDCNNLSIGITGPIGNYDTVASVSNLTVNITGFNSSNYHWHWQLDTPFPTSGLAGGNMVTSGTTATLTGLTVGTHTIYVTLVDSNHNVLPTPVTDSAQIIIAPMKFVVGNVPNWQQPYFYESLGFITSGYITNNIQYTNWCSPTAAACQLGHLNHNYFNLILPEKGSGHKDGISDLIDASTVNTVDTGVPGLGTKPWDNIADGHGWGDYLIDGSMIRPAPNAMFSWYPYAPTTIGACELTDFGWLMNTNNSSESNNIAGTRVGNNIINLSPYGTQIHNIYLGLKDFYRLAGYDGMVGILYHRLSNGTTSSYPSNSVLPVGTPEQPYGMFPQYWIDSGLNNATDANGNLVHGADPMVTWDTIKTEIDHGRTVIACTQGWNLQLAAPASVHSDFPNTDNVYEKGQLGVNLPDGIFYYHLAASSVSHPNPDHQNSNMTLSDSTDPPHWGGTALGHTVLIVGYIPAGAADDVSVNGDTYWLILRDNDNMTHRNVIVPFISAVASPTGNVDTTRWLKDMMMATVYTDPARASMQLAICTP